MSLLWAAATVFVLSASICCRVLIITRFRRAIYTPEWIGPALLAMMLLVAGFVVVAVMEGGI
jgi:hypothetical protein